MFRVATGWLGWPPDVAMRAPIPMILLAYDGKIEMLKATNPFGGGEETGEPKPQTAAEMKSIFGNLIKKRDDGKH